MVSPQKGRPVRACGLEDISIKMQAKIVSNWQKGKIYYDDSSGGPELCDHMAAGNCGLGGSTKNKVDIDRLIDDDLARPAIL